MPVIDPEPAATKDGIGNHGGIKPPLARARRYAQQRLEKTGARRYIFHSEKEIRK
jgi:hypothetical protein